MMFQSPEKWDGCYTHRVFYGSDAYDRLIQGVTSLMADHKLTGRTFHADFWQYILDLYREDIKNRLDSNEKARAILVHRDLLTRSCYDWHSLFIASPDFMDLPCKCEFFGNDVFEDVHITGDWHAPGATKNWHLWPNKDYVYLRTLVPNMFGSSVPSPAISVVETTPPAIFEIKTPSRFDWYDPSNPLTSLQSKLQRFRYVRQRSAT